VHHLEIILLTYFGPQTAEITLLIFTVPLKFWHGMHDHIAMYLVYVQLEEPVTMA